MTYSLHLWGVNKATSCRFPSIGGTTLGNFCHHDRSFLKDAWMVLGDNFLEVSNSNMIFNEFNISAINLIQNEQVKLDEICLDTQGHFKAHLSNFMDVLGHLTSKLHETRNTDYTCYNNSFKDLKTSLIIHK